MDDSTPSLLLSVGCRTRVFSNLEYLECVVRHQKYPMCVQFVRRQPRFQRNGNNPKLSPSARSRRQDSTTTDYYSLFLINSFISYFFLGSNQSNESSTSTPIISWSTSFKNTTSVPSSYGNNCMVFAPISNAS